MIDDATARFPLACLYVGKQLDQLRKARDPILRAQGDAYANMGSADMKGNDTSTAVRWYLKWCWFADEEVISRLQAFSTWDEKRAVENKMIAFFIWLVATRGVAVDTAKGYLSTVRAWHERKWGPMMPFHSPAKLKAVMKGMDRAFQAPPRRPRRGVKTQHLAAGLKKAFGGQSLFELGMVAGTQLAFCALLRAAEWAVGDKDVFQPERNLCLSDVKYTMNADGTVAFDEDELGEYMTVMMRPCKKLKYMHGKMIPVMVRDGSILQPVSAMREYLTKRAFVGDASTVPLFVNATGAPLRAADVRKAVKKIVLAVGENPNLYGSHSLRIGGATAALAAGVAPAHIQLLGRWDSDCYQIYCRLCRQAAIAVGSKVASTRFEDFEGMFDHEELVPSTELLARAKASGEAIDASDDEVYEDPLHSAARQLVAGVLFKDGAVLMEKRRNGAAYQGQFIFPSGRIGAGEQCRTALVKRMNEVVGVTLRTTGVYVDTASVGRYSIRHYLLRQGQWKGDPIVTQKGQTLVWMRVQDLALRHLLGPSALQVMFSVLALVAPPPWRCVGPPRPKFCIGCSKSEVHFVCCLCGAEKCARCEKCMCDDSDTQAGSEGEE